MSDATDDKQASEQQREEEQQDVREAEGAEGAAQAEHEEQKGEEEEKEEPEEPEAPEPYEESDPRRSNPGIRKFVEQTVESLRKKHADKGDAPRFPLKDVPALTLDAMRVASEYSSVKEGRDKKRIVVCTITRLLDESCEDSLPAAADLCAETVDALFSVERAAFSGIKSFQSAKAKKKGGCIIS